ncbi:MAG: 16S rRNA (cytosine(967)-C(5))-methyltransferase RsmB [Thiobacillaceae bacterium]
MRRLAARALASVLDGGRSLDRVLASLRLEGRARAAVMDYAYGVLRHLGLLDFVLTRLLDRPLKDPELRHLLYVGLYELYSGTTPDYAAVNETVAAAPARARPLVNAVLRNFQRRREALLAQAQTDPVARWNHPAWWIERLQAEYPRAWQGILEASNTHPPMTLRVNRRRASLEDYQRRLDAAGIAAVQTGEWALTLARPIPVIELPGFAEGLVSVQDLGAQHAAGLLDGRDHMRVLDACAAPGGKTAHLLERHDLELTALDLDPLRLKRVRDNLKRLGLAAQVLAGDAGRPAQWWDGHAYDRILLDAPCTASGVVRRHPDARWLKRAADTTTLARRQRELLEALWPLLRPGGKLLYATCSLFSAENRDVVTAFLDHHPEAAEEPLILTGGSLGQLLPDSHHDGFFYARLVKT